MKIALTGGIACGKSLVAKFFRELGVQTLDADDVVHELEAPGGAAVPAIVSRFGSSILASNGGIDRSKLASMVFTGATRSFVTGTDRSDTPSNDIREKVPLTSLHDLEAILHPFVRRRLLAFAGNQDTFFPCHTSASPFRFRISIIPLLFESHFESDYDIILCVSSTEDCQIDRMIRTRGYTREQAEARLAAQMPMAEKAARADWTIHNNSTPMELKAAVRRCAEWLSGKMGEMT